jgi:hypothetical protein
VVTITDDKESMKKQRYNDQKQLTARLTALPIAEYFTVVLLHNVDYWCRSNPRQAAKL